MWNAEQAATYKPVATEEKPPLMFFTGKPYIPDAGGYVYKYRTYNPEMLRWTSADPSGFPDGVNNRNYAPNPADQIDATGLATTIDKTAPGIGGPASVTYTNPNTGAVYTVTAATLFPIALPTTGTAMTGLNSEFAGQGNYSFFADSQAVSVTVNGNYAVSFTYMGNPVGGMRLLITATSSGGVDDFVNSVSATDSGNNNPYADKHGPSTPYSAIPGAGDNGSGGFVDQPGRLWSYATSSSPETWTGTLYIVQPNGSGGYDVIGGITYGFTITESITE